MKIAVVGTGYVGLVAGVCFADTGHHVIDLMVELNQEEGTTLVLVTHDTELASKAHRIVRLAGGRIVGDEKVERG